MHETLAFLRLVWICDRKLIAFAAAAAIAGTLLSFAAAETLPTAKLSFMPKASLRDIAVVSAMLLTLVPAMITVIGLFSFQGNGESLEMEGSCCSHWLLRLPIKSWKIAIVPIVLKTIWVSVCWFFLTIPLKMMAGTQSIPWLEPSVSLSAIAIGFLAITWRPFRSGWRRVAAMAVGAIFSLGLFALPFNQDSVDYQHLLRFSIFGSFLVYSAAVWLLFDSVRIARTHATGLIPATRRFASQATTKNQQAPKQVNHRDALRALVWHDIYRARKLTAFNFAIVLIPGMIFILSIGLKGATVFMAIMISAVAAWAVLAASMYPLNQKAGTVLPLYLVASPIPSYRIAWTRLISSLLIMMPFLLFTILVFAMCSLWESNRSEWLRWANQWAKSLGTEDNTVWMGIRISIAAVIGSSIAMYGRTLSFTWVSMTGRDWLAGIVFCLVGAMVLASIVIPISWVFRFENLDEVKAAAMWWLMKVPTIIAVVLALKICFAAIAGVLLHKKGLAPGSAISRVLVIWAVIVVVCSLVIYALIPDPRAGMVLCLAATATLVPLGSVLWMPISVDSDRHR